MKENLKAIPFIGLFPEEALSGLEKVVSAEHFSKGDIIFREGSPGVSVYLVESGEIEISKEGRTLSVITAGNMFGEMAMFETESRSADASARTDAVVYSIANDDFRKFIYDNPGPGLDFLFSSVREMSRRLRRTSEYFITIFETGKIVGADLGIEKMSEKLISRLLNDLEATGGMMMIYNRFTGFYDLAHGEGCVILDPESASTTAGEASGARISFIDGRGVVVGEPVSEDGSNLGYLIFERSGSSEPFTNEQMITVAAVANQAGLGILKAYGKQDEEARRRLEQGRMGGL